MSGNEPPPHTTEQGPSRAIAAASPILSMLLIAAALMPEELSIRPGGILLTVPRLLLLAATPAVAVRAVIQTTRPDFRFVWSDAFMPLAAFWMFLSVSMVQGIDRAMIGATGSVVEFTISYYLIRTTVRKPGQALALARFAACAFAINGLLGVADTLTGRHIVHELADAMTGYGRIWRIDERNGFIRAQGAQEHPILMGTVCCYGIVLSMVVLKGPMRILTIACGFMGALASLSSAPLSAVGLGIGLLIYRRVMGQFPWRWRLLIGTAASFMTALMVIHPRPFSFLFDFVALDPVSGYYRLLIWNIVGGLVLDNPVFGLGLESTFARDFGVSNTIDSVWLQCATTFGIPGSLLIGLCLIGSCSRAVDTDAPVNLDAAEKALGLGLSIIIFLYVYIGFTVDFWGCTWILMGVFTGMRASVGAMAALPPRAMIFDTGLAPASFGTREAMDRRASLLSPRGVGTVFTTIRRQ